jgi:hypothetical protein
MSRRATFMLTCILLSPATAGFPQIGFAQTDPLLGFWQLNLAKSKFSPAPPYKSMTAYWQGEGQNRKLTLVGIDAAGNPLALLHLELIDDGKPHPVTGSRFVDAITGTRVDANTTNISYLKEGKVVQNGTVVTSTDGRTYTVTLMGTLTGGQQFNTFMSLTSNSRAR